MVIFHSYVSSPEGKDLMIIPLGAFHWPNLAKPKKHFPSVVDLVATKMQPSGKRLHSYGKSPFLMGKSTISMVMFNSYVTNYQRVDFMFHLLFRNRWIPQPLIMCSFPRDKTNPYPPGIKYHRWFSHIFPATFQVPVFSSLSHISIYFIQCFNRWEQCFVLVSVAICYKNIMPNTTTSNSMVSSSGTYAIHNLS